MKALFTISGIVVHGLKIGASTFKTPTANLKLNNHESIPTFGVYISRVLLEESWYWGVTNVGINPTVRGENPGIETFIFDWHGDLYNKTIEVQLIKFMRNEKRFKSDEELINQIAKDKAQARELISKMQPISV